MWVIQFKVRLAKGPGDWAWKAAGILLLRLVIAAVRGLRKHGVAIHDFGPAIPSSGMDIRAWWSSPEI